MVQLRQTYNQFKGLLFVLDPKQVPEPHITSGTNFLIDAAGPYSAFGSSIVTHEGLAMSDNVATFRVLDYTLIFTENAILRYDTILQMFFPVFVFDPIPTEVTRAPWFEALVGTKCYFVRAGSPLLEFDPINDIWAELSPVDGVPANPVSVTNAGGRLIVLGDDIVKWSTVDMFGPGLNGDVDDGVGFQITNIVGSGQPYSVLPTADGFITYKSSGMMKSQFLDSIIAFRHFPFQKGTSPPINAFSAVEVGTDEHIILNEKGLFITKGSDFQPWQPLFSEFMNRQLLPTLTLDKPDVIKLHYFDDFKWFMVSIDSTSRGGSYDKAHVINLSRNEWGVFNRPHKSFGVLGLGKNDASFKFGYIDPMGLFNMFTDEPHVEQDFNRIEYVHHRNGIAQYAARDQEDVTVFPTIGRFNNFDAGKILNILPSGWYQLMPTATVFSPSDFFALPITERSPYTVTTTTIFPTSMEGCGGLESQDYFLKAPDFGALNSTIDIGVLRLVGEESDDRFTYINDLAVDAGEGTPGQEFIDYMSLVQFPTELQEDWLAIPDNTEDEDWGLAVVFTTNLDVTLFGTLNAKDVFEDQTEVLVVYKSTSNIQYYKAKVGGIYNILSLKAQQEGQSFHLKFLGLTGIIGMRL